MVISSPSTTRSRSAANEARASETLIVNAMTEMLIDAEAWGTVISPTPAPSVGAVIIVTGSVVVRPDDLEEAVAISLAHVRRSRTEPGCLLHSVHHDVEDPNRLVFLEQWADRAALDAHFAVPASLDFVTRMSELAAEPPSMDIHETMS